MSIHADPLVVNAEVARRLELGGYRPDHRHEPALSRVPGFALAGVPFAASAVAFVTRRARVTHHPRHA